MKQTKTGKKPRKTTAGPIREKARTMKNLVAAVGKVLKKKGYPGLSIANIAVEAKVDRKLVYAYFGNLDNLVETYITEQDYWKTKAKKQIAKLLEQDQMSKEEMHGLLFGQFETVLQDKTLQRILQWELSEPNTSLRKLADAREEVGEELIQKLEKNIGKDGLDIRAVLALQTAGLYYLAIHAKSNGSTFCGIDINEAEGRKRIETTLMDILEKIDEKKNQN
ncbi:TetR/AcrR family transcriptional regulator [Sphingobacterium sp. 1.A.4]|uniref:TetR/AcrR family transcriptional regulator n=1 Tax=Sphingobacterium sp. 1.A.4 TaxID=2044603 RepID=UPI000C0C0369|nr:TetR/AcrR family transcriptional regulator [Sphingobacterium sp. 1.A.4]